MIVRTGFTLPQVIGLDVDWAVRNNIERGDDGQRIPGPGIDAEKTFVARFTAAARAIVETIRTPLRNPDEARCLVVLAKDAKPGCLRSCSCPPVRGQR